MKRRIVSRRAAVTAFSILLVFASIGLLHSLFAQRYTQNAATVIETGKTQLFGKTIPGALGAFHTFQTAFANDYASAEPADKIKIRVYLAFTRLLDVVLRNDGGSVDTLTELLAQYGVTRTEDAEGLLESVRFRFPLNNKDKVILPAGAPPTAEALRTFFAGPFLTALNASIADMDAAIALCPSTEGIDREIISKTLIDPDDPTRPNVEMDAGDYYFFRAFLKFLKGFVLMNAAYNADMSIREIVALANMDAGPKMIKALLDRYPDYLRVRNGGAAELLQAKAALIGGIDDYVIASDKIRNDSLVESGAEELLSLDQDEYQEALFRENLAKVKTSLLSLTGNEPADLVTERIGTEYSVYGAASFTTNESDWWEKGYHPEQHGYTLLKTTDNKDSASNTATFNGTFAYYIITTKAGNMAPVDAVGSGGTYFPNIADGNTLYYYNISGAPNGNYGLVGGRNNGNSNGFAVVHPATSISSLTVYLTNVANIAHEEHFSLNLFPLFGNESIAPKALRDLLPQLNEFGYAVPGTMGHGVGDDATLGGILPDLTQKKWVRDNNHEFFLPAGNITIYDLAGRAINVQDAGIDDWNGISPVYNYIYGETGDPVSDIRSLYLARDATNLYFRIDTAGTIPTSSMSYGASLKQLPGDQYELPGDLKVQAYYDWYSSRWLAVLYKVDSLGNMMFVSSLGSADFSVFGNHVEMKVSLAQLGAPEGRFIGVYSRYYWGDGGDDHHTCLQIQTPASVTGTLTVPGYNGVGAVYVGVYEYTSDFSREPEERLGSQLIFPDGSGHLPATYTIGNLPVGSRVFVAVFWDRDGNGIVSPGDYTNFYQPFTTAAGENPLPLTVNDDHPSYPPPQFTFAEVLGRRFMGGSSSRGGIVTAGLTGPSQDDVTITVTGQGQEFTLIPRLYIHKKGVLYAYFSQSLPDGVYTFTAVDSLGRRAEATYDFQARYDLPDAQNFSPADKSYTGTAPTLSWTPPATGGPYLYEVWIMDSSDRVLWNLPARTTASSVAIPEGVLLPDTRYLWFMRLYENAEHPMNFIQSSSFAFYTGSYQAAPAFSSVRMGTRPPTGATTVYSHWVDAKLPGVAPWDVTGWRLKKGSSVVYPGTTAPTFDVRVDDSFFTVSFTTPNPLANGDDYAFEMDVSRSGVPTVFAKTGIHYAFQNVPVLDVTSLVPSGNYYFKTPAPVFSWNPADNPDTYYRLRIFDPLGSLVIWQSLWSKNPSVTVPTGVLKPGVTYFWTVQTSLTIDPSYVSAYVNTEGNSANRVMYSFTLPPPLLGDVSGNGEVTLEDAILALQVLSGLLPTVVSSGDVNADGRIGLPEAIFILQAVSGLR